MLKMLSTVEIVANKKKQQLKSTHTVTTESELPKYDIEIYILIMCAIKQKCNTVQMQVYHIS